MSDWREYKHDELEDSRVAARLNADALKAMQADRDEGRRHVRHLLDALDAKERGPCDGCRAAREWSES